MLKNVLALILMLYSSQITFAKEIPVTVKTLLKISTSDGKLQEGDNINLIVTKDVYSKSKLYIKSGAQVQGVITSLVDNGFNCQEASIYAENFRVKNTDGKTIKLNGIVYKAGHDHELFTQIFVVLYPFIRGGEVKIDPDKDIFTLYLEENL